MFIAHAHRHPGSGEVSLPEGGGVNAARRHRHRGFGEVPLAVRASFLRISNLQALPYRISTPPPHRYFAITSPSYL